MSGEEYDGEELKKSGEKHFSKDDSLAIDVRMVVDECMDYKGIKLKRKISKISDIPSPAPLETAPPDATWDAAIELLSVTSRNVYEFLRVPLACSHNVSKKKFLRIIHLLSIVQ